MLHNRISRPGLSLVLFTLLVATPSWTQPGKPSPEQPAWIATAGSQLEAGKLDAVESTLWTVLGSDPNDVRALTMLGVVRARQQRYAEAESLFRRVLQIDPKSIAASRNLASALLAQDKPDDAIQAYRQATQLNPQDADLKLEVAKLELARGNFAGALSALDAMKAARLPAPAIVLKAASLLGMGRKSEAEALIPQLNGAPGPALDLAQIFIDASDPDAALKTLSLINPVPRPLAAPVSYLKGRAQAQKGNTDAAMVNFHQASTADPKSLEPQLALAQMYAAQGKHDDSLAILRKARELKPDSREVLRPFIVESMRAGQNDRALEAAQQLQRLSADSKDRYLVASVMIQQKQFLSASHILEDYVAQQPDDAKAFLGLGIAYLNLLRYPEAQQALERSLQLDPSLAESHYEIGLLTSQQGNRADALQHWQKAVELQPRHALALFSLGTAYLEAGNLAEAEDALSRSLASDPGNMKTEYSLSLVLNKLGKSEEAKQHLEHYRKMQEREHSGSAKKMAEHP